NTEKASDDHNHDHDSSHHAPHEETHEGSHRHHHHHDHDDSHHQKELERTKYETLEVKYDVLKKKAMSMVGLAFVFCGLAWLNKRRGK
ncbi:MAG: hypothetical protein AB1403_19670, partial [Candidatus Riflebacteria bacterium]